MQTEKSSVTTALHTFDVIQIALRKPGMPRIDDLEIAGLLAEVAENIRPIVPDTDHAMLCGLVAAILMRNGMTAEVLQ